MSPLQKLLVAAFVAWVVVSTAFIFARGGSLFEDSKSGGYGLMWKYSPRTWRKITLWIAPLWLLAMIASFFL